MNKKTYLGILTIITIVCIFTGLLYHVGHAVGGFLSGRNYFLWDKWYEDDNNDENDEAETSGSTKQQTLDAFTEIESESAVMDLTVQPGDSYSIRCDATAGLMPKYTLQDGKLNISQKSVSFNFVWGINSNHCHVTVTIPQGTVLKNVQTETATGDTKISGIQTQSSSIKSNTGDISIRDSKLGNTVIKTDTGDVEAKNCGFTSSDISSSVGDIDVESDTDLSAWKLDLETSVGDVEVNNDDQGKTFSQNGSDGTMKLSGSVGDISLKY